MRYQSVEEMGSDLDAWMNRRPVQAYLQSGEISLLKKKSYSLIHAAKRYSLALKISAVVLAGAGVVANFFSTAKREAFIRSQSEVGVYIQEAENDISRNAFDDLARTLKLC